LKGVTTAPVVCALRYWGRR